MGTLSAHTARLSATLTALTDDILRCSSRLAYEVEILRGETLGLAESLGRKDSSRGEAIGVFVPRGLEDLDDGAPTASENGVAGEASPVEHANHLHANDSPSVALAQLQELHRLRSSLLSLKTLFSRALSWPLPPSLTNSPANAGTSSLISLQSPSTPENERLEREGQAVLRNQRSEVSNLLAMGDVEGAKRKVEDLRELTGVWKGTREEKARKGVVDRLEEMVDEWEKEKSRKGPQPQGRGVEQQQRQQPGRTGTPRGGGSGGTGLLGNLRRFREEIYME